MILQTMLQRLYASLARGPGLNARPHHSRQRLDLADLSALQGTDPAPALRELLSGSRRALEFPAKVRPFTPPDYPEAEWSDAQKASARAADPQNRVLQKLRDIAADATDYFNDHGENALFLGFPLLSLPATGGGGPRETFQSKSLLAPLLLAPVTLRVRQGTRAGLTLETAGEGAELLVPNPALLAWIEQQTGEDTDALFADESGEDPWGEVAALLELVTRAAGLDPARVLFGADTPLQAVPRATDLPAEPTLIPSAVLGLFPLTNPGLLRDTKWMLENEPALANPVRAFLSPRALAEAEPAPPPAAREWDHGAAAPVAPADDPANDSASPPPPAPTSTSPAPTPSPSTTATPPTATGAGADEADRFLVTHADPCQAGAVALARRSAALVVHGPPGTGKSQTIANIVGDHLARGERVLFVCDKRTALDVVKYRLDGMGLGELCGVIHDPAHDRRDLYLALRERLDALPEQAPPADPAASLRRVNERLATLQTELRDAFDRLHARAPEAGSFHELTGRWLALRARVSAELPELPGLSLDLLDLHRADLEECLLRAAPARWSESPFRDRLGIALGEWLALDPASIPRALETVAQAARALDAANPGLAPENPENASAHDTAPAPPAPLSPPLVAERPPTAPSAVALSSVAQSSVAPPSPPPLVAELPLAEQAARRRQLAEQLAALARHGQPRLAALALDGARLTALRTRLAELEAAGVPPSSLDVPPDRELALALGPTPPALGETNRRIASLDTWDALGGALRRLFAFAEKKAAREALDPLGLPLGPEGIARARTFYQALRARWRWRDFAAQAFGEPTPATVANDDTLRSLRDTLPDLFALHDLLQGAEFADLATFAAALLRDAPAALEAGATALRRSAAHADAIAAWLAAEHATGLFTDEALAADLHAALAGEPATPGAEARLAFAPTLDEAVRLSDRLRALPAPLPAALAAVIDQGLDWTAAEPVLRSAALAGAIRARLRTEPALARIDTRRIEAAFSELAERTAEKQGLVRAHVVHRWRKLWRERLLAATGTRLNSTGAALRQRLFVRGQRALKLRQMIAAGADAAGGDPLFDLCPVWMAGPATVAQVFPRVALFDVIVFDEASQCRLEEALPVLLRGKRVVIAGDPKQLPPTRFFEQALAESDDTGAETADDVFLQQQSEAEDLLAAALNLEVQEAFLDVHYRSRNEALIGFSNDAFYSSRLQPIPGHPRNKALRVPIRLLRADGLYENRGNIAEARAAVELVAELLDADEAPSIGIACFNLNQRDLILDELEARAAADRVFAERLEIARKRRGRDSFEGLFVKNLENVQGDERDHMIICTTFGRDKDGKFRRNFGALSRAGGERRLNVLVTRARDAIHVVTSIPRAEYLAAEPANGERPTGRHQLYAYLRYAERLEELYRRWQDELETARRDTAPACVVAPSAQPSAVAEALGGALHREHGVGSTVHWGNEGFCVDLALTHPELPEDVTLGVLADFNRYRKTPDPIAWELFRTTVLRGQGWQLHRVWSPGLFRDPAAQVAAVKREHAEQLRRHRAAGASDDSRSPLGDSTTR